MGTGRLPSGDVELELVYIAAANREARRAEQLFTEHTVEYKLALEPFLTYGLFGPRERTGLFFYVAPDWAEYCRDVLKRHGLSTGIVDDEI